MVNEIISLVAIGGSLVGAALRSAQSAYSTGAFVGKKFVGALLSSLIPSLTVINFANIGSQASAYGYTALFVLMALAGAGAASMLSAAHKDTSTG